MAETRLEIPGYSIEREIGRGGMARVYLAVQKKFGRLVAIKVVSPEYTADPSFGKRFVREARIIALLIIS
jgi:serine/threonine protein kinase